MTDKYEIRETAVIVAGFVALIVAACFAIPWVFETFATVSASDAARPAGQRFTVDDPGWSDIPLSIIPIGVVSIAAMIGPFIFVNSTVLGIERVNQVACSLFLVAVMIIGGVAAYDSSDRSHRAEVEAFTTWADARYGVDLSGLDDDAIRSLYDPEDDFTRVRNPDTGEFVTSRTDTRGAVLVERVDAEELPTKGQ